MLALNINNPTVEKFYKIETYNIKQSITKGFEEIKLQNNGQLEKKELKHILDEL